MSKKDKFETIEVEDVNLLPDLLDGNHRVIPIVTGGDEAEELRSGSGEQTHC